MNAACREDSETRFEMHRFGGATAAGETFDPGVLSNLRRTWRTRSISLAHKEQSKPDGEGAVPESPKRYCLAGTRQFHLLSDEDLDEMRGLLETMRDRRSEVVARWYELYAQHFGEECSLGESEFAGVFEPAILRQQADLLEKNMDRYAEDVTRLGELLVGRGVPLQELIALLQLFEEAVHPVLQSDAQPTADLSARLGRLSHIRIALLAEAYQRALTANSSNGTGRPDREAVHLPHAATGDFHGIVGTSRAMRLLRQRIEAASKTCGTVLVVGESGTGKELVARALHGAGPRREASFVALNCAALPKDLIESELFGHRRGAFSGATAEYAGLFRAAEGGTLFLDEITEMSVETQSKLLRAIQERAVRPIGSVKEVPVNVRLIASTNREPQAAMADGHLRKDLYYRLQASVITIPPLRERSEDLPLLVQHFIAMFNRDSGRKLAGVEREAMDAILHHSWPGNVRELSNTIEGAFTFGQGPLIALADLPPVVVAASVLSDSESPACGKPVKPDAPVLTTFAEIERDLIARALLNAGGNKVHAAKGLKISRKKLYAKIAKYELCAAPQ